ncbi:MAG: hypothetical protein CMB25_08125 [Euryarchaeota archaeon]|nr:hypothetical protein [Euryarchaeota archaeon]|tara:strand:- start:3114 stop:3569 length:456 start_codon:yes stop_codon:yes gene_type:complete
MDPITILAGIKTGLAAGKSVAGLSKQIGQFFDATDNAKKQLQKKGVSSKSVNAIAMERFQKLRQAAEAEEELKKFICESLGPSHWNTLLKMRREVLAEKREAEARARREAQERADLALTAASIVLLLTAAFVGSTAYLHHMKWLNIWDYLP